MRSLVVVIALLSYFSFTPAFADNAKAPTTVAYTTTDTDIGTILDNPALKAIVDKYIPNFSSGDNVDMARSMTLKGIQQFAPDVITDQVLSQIDAEFSKVSAGGK